MAEARRADPDLVLVEREGAHAIVTLNDPDKLNPLSAALTVRLRDALTDLAGDESLRAVVLTGADPAFCAGGDLRLMRDTAQPMLERRRRGARAVALDPHGVRRRSPG